MSALEIRGILQKDVSYPYQVPYNAVFVTQGIYIVQCIVGNIVTVFAITYHASCTSVMPCR